MQREGSLTALWLGQPELPIQIGISGRCAASAPGEGTSACQCAFQGVPRLGINAGRAAAVQGAAASETVLRFDQARFDRHHCENSYELAEFWEVQQSTNLPEPGRAGAVVAAVGTLWGLSRRRAAAPSRTSA